MKVRRESRWPPGEQESQHWSSRVRRSQVYSATYFHVLFNKGLGKRNSLRAHEMSDAVLIASCGDVAPFLVLGIGHASDQLKDVARAQLGAAVDARCVEKARAPFGDVQDADETQQVVFGCSRRHNMATWT